MDYNSVIWIWKSGHKAFLCLFVRIPKGKIILICSEQWCTCLANDMQISSTTCTFLQEWSWIFSGPLPFSSKRRSIETSLPFVTGRLSETEFRELRWFCHTTLNIDVSCFRVLTKKLLEHIFTKYRLKLGNSQQVYFRTSHSRVVTKLPCFARFWSDFMKVRLVCGSVTIFWPLYAHPPPPPTRHDELASEKHRDRNVNFYEDMVSSVMSVSCVRVASRTRLTASRFPGEQGQVCCLVPAPLFDSEAKQEGVNQRGFWLTQLKQMLRGSKCLVQQSLSNVNLLATRREHGEISISLLSTCRHI